MNGVTCGGVENRHDVEWGVMVVMGGDVDMGCDGGDGWRCGYGV